MSDEPTLVEKMRRLADAVEWDADPLIVDRLRQGADRIAELEADKATMIVAVENALLSRIAELEAENAVIRDMILHGAKYDLLRSWARRQ